MNDVKKSSLLIRKASEALKEGVGHAKILIWGNSGTGKTWLSCTANKPLIALTEKNGMVSVSHSNKDADYVFIESIDDLRELIHLAKSGKLSDYETLVFDSITELQKMIRTGILDELNTKDMTFKTWGKLAERTLAFVREIRDLPFHIICTALRNEKMGEDGNLYTVGPQFEGQKTGNEIMQYFSAVAMLTCDISNNQTFRRLYFTGKEGFMIKPCYPLQGIIKDPNMSTIISAIVEGKELEYEFEAEEKKETKQSKRRVR